MRKYICLIKNEISLLTTYKFDLFARWVFGITQVIVYYYLWRLTSNSLEDKNKFLLYFILFHGILNGMHTGRTASNISNAIKTADINNIILKPISFPLTQVIRTLTPIIARSIVPTILLILGYIILPAIFAPASIIHLTVSVLFFAFGLFTWNILFSILGFIAFWTIENNSLITVIDLILNFLKGAYIPYFLFPGIIQRFLSYTPIPYFISLPIDIYMGNYQFSDMVKNLLIYMIWFIIFLFIAKYLYKKGLQRYEGYGI